MTSFPELTGSNNPEAHDWRYYEVARVYNDRERHSERRGRLLRLAIAISSALFVLSAAMLSGARADTIICKMDNNARTVCPGPIIKSKVKHRAPVDANGNRILIGGRPKGCPFRYCGCGLAKYLGIDDRRLWLAKNWERLFRSVRAAPGMAAVRRGGGHVMLLVEHISGNRWRVRDYNGGRHLSWIHERDVRGFVFVDPSNRVAQVTP